MRLPESIIEVAPLRATINPALNKSRVSICGFLCYIVKMKKAKSQTKLPDFFKPLFWSYNFVEINPQKNKKLIVVNTINYGDLNHWRWLVQTYGKNGVREILENIPASEVRARARRLAALLFDVKSFNYAPRGTRSKK